MSGSTAPRSPVKYTYGRKRPRDDSSPWSVHTPGSPLSPSRVRSPSRPPSPLPLRSQSPPPSQPSPPGPLSTGTDTTGDLPDLAIKDSLQDLPPELPPAKRPSGTGRLTDYFKPASAQTRLASAAASPDPSKPAKATMDQLLYNSNTESLRPGTYKSPRTPGTLLSPKSKRSAKDSFQQLFLDLGQKQSGIRKCRVCEMEYSVGHPDDEKMHELYHKAVVKGIEFHNISADCIVRTFTDDGARIAQVTNDCKANERKKAREVMSFVNQELGSFAFTEEDFAECKIFIYVTRRDQVVGCVAAKQITTAFRTSTSTGTGASTDDTALGSVLSRSDEPVDCVCGISRIWVARSERRKGIASRLLDTVCRRFVFGTTLDRAQLAFSQPTLEGQMLARSFTAQADFLIFG
ncbi:ESCO1/2 acetyl-transferase-domain-containing protein [Polychytrium aggregatum]|uniref:ESCO1/2 acetyl-transferase-domain-containing protein n=1 Tax=Polychytrium aggregatum TaxID=110093 RepID=UPI0022FEC562|nr:ESCO1/2 acetyl-transferase-domain-containing protein [Polychytrium aggregatum]KAI9199631.1 ESCO1/2 acetyl-transferase-domain-containing protein [Polychytrium aggregatum]